LYEEAGDYEQAEPLYIRAFERRCDRLGDDHPDSLDSLNALASLYVKQMKYFLAKPLLERYIGEIIISIHLAVSCRVVSCFVLMGVVSSRI
jgi:Tetratricopeptide repeat